MEFKAWSKIPRLNRDIVITEKIDGTNAVIYNGEDGTFLVGSRTRWITPDNDNQGFATWAYKNKEELQKLGKGRHYGEWWGSGIQRGYGLPKGEKRFSLFNVSRWFISDAIPSCCHIVPILYTGPFSENSIHCALDNLHEHGSMAAPFMNPEGIVIYHTASGGMFKVTLEDDEKPKSKGGLNEKRRKSY